MPPPLTASAWLRLDVVAPIVDRLRPARVLEVGAGVGGFGTRFAAIGCEYVAVEPAAASRRILSARLARVPGATASVVGDLMDVGSELGHAACAADADEGGPSRPGGGRFDLVCAFEVLEHVVDDAETLAHWVSHARPGGHVLLTVPAFADRFAATDELVGHLRRYDPDDLTELCTAAGLVDVETRCYSFPAGNVLETARNLMAGRALRRSEAGSTSTRTEASGRWHQPGDSSGPTMERVTAPLRWLQRRFPDRGPGLLMLARRPHAAAPCADAGA